MTKYEFYVIDRKYYHANKTYKTIKECSTIFSFSSLEEADKARREWQELEDFQTGRILEVREGNVWGFATME